jgi:hypothetical protein
MRTIPGLALFVLLAVLLAVPMAAQTQTPQQLADEALKQKVVACQAVTSQAQCHSKYVAGCGKTASAKYDPYLDYFKNDLPGTDSKPAEKVDLAKLSQLEKDTPPSLVEGNHNSFSTDFVKLNEGEIVEADGYLYYAESTGPESSNCYDSGASNVDIHIGIGFDAKKVTEAKSKPAAKTPQFLDLQAHSMIVEMTPHYRAQKEPKWSLASLQAAYGKQVKVVGQLMADNDHHKTADDCALSGATSNCWRLSIWEIHPVTAFYVCTASAGCTSSSTTGWTKLEDWKPSGGGGKKKPPAKHPTKPA